jgi:hypothetical protein
VLEEEEMVTRALDSIAPSATAYPIPDMCQGMPCIETLS